MRRTTLVKSIARRMRTVSHVDFRVYIYTVRQWNDSRLITASEVLVAG